MKNFSGKVDVKCHQSCLVALVFCTKLYIKLAVYLRSFSKFSFPFNFRTANALDLKFCILLLGCLFSNTLLAIFDILFGSRVIHRFAPKNGPKLTCGRIFQHNFISKANLKISRARFFSSQIILVEETRRVSLARLVFNLKAIEFRAFFASFTFLGTLKWYNFSKYMPKQFFFRQAFRQKKPFEDSPSGYKIRF